MTDPGSTPPPVPPGALASSPLGQLPPEAVTSGGDDRLATAFTRIVGEQLNEQREISALLSDLRARLNSLDGLTQEMDSSVARRLSAVATEVRDFIERRGNPEDARREAEAAREQIVAARSQVYELSSSLGASIEGIEAELAGLAPAVTGLGPLLATLAPRIEELSDDLATLNGGVTSLADGMTTLQGDVSTLNGELTVLGGDLTSLNGGVTSLADGVTTLQGSVSSLNDGVSGLQSGVSALPGQESLTELSDGMAGMRTDLRSLPEQVGGAVGGRVAESLDQIRDSIQAVVAELAALQVVVSETPEPDPLMTELEAQLAGVASRVSALGELPEQLEGLATDLGAVWQAVQVLDGKLGALPIDEDLVPAVAAVGAAVAVLEAGVRDLDARFESFVASNDGGPDPELAEVSDSVVAVGVSLSEMRATLEGVSRRLDEFADRPVDESTLRQLAGDIAALNSRFASLDSHVTALDTTLAAIETNLAAEDDIEIGPAMDGLAAALAGVAVGVDDLDAKLEERLDALTLALPAPAVPDARLDSVGASVQAVQGSVDVLGTELTAAVAALTSRVDEMFGRIDEVHGRVDAVQGRIEDVHAQTVPVHEPEQLEDLALGPLADLSDSVSVVGAGVAAMSETLAGLGVDLVALDTRLAQLEASSQQGPVPLSSSDLTVITGPLTGEVAGLRGDLDNVRRLLLEELPEDTIDPAQLAADIDATLSETVGTKVSEQVSQHVAGVLETVLSAAVQHAVAEAVNAAVQDAVGASGGAAVGEAVAQSVDDAVARVLQTSVEDAVRITVSPTLAQAIDAAVDRAAGQQVALEARLRSHVDEAVMALAEIVLNTPNLAISHAGASAAPTPSPLTDERLSEPALEPEPEPDDRKRRFGRK